MKLIDDLLKVGLTGFGDMMVQLEPPRVRAAHCRHAILKAEPGMVILRKYRWYLDGRVIPGAYSHSGLVESKYTVIHAIAEGVIRDDILDFVKDADGFALVRFKEPYYPGAAVARARQNLGKGYDFKFSVMDDGKLLYCHENTADDVAGGGILIEPEEKTFAGITRKIFTADCFLKHDKAELVYEARF